MTKEQFQNSVLPLKDRMFRLAFRYLNNRSDSEDAVQDVMLKVWENADASEVKNLEAWCMTLTKNKSLDMLKRKGRTEVNLDGAKVHPKVVNDPSKIMEMGESIAKVKSIIQKLPEGQRLAIELRDFQGKTYAEIAEFMEVDISLVKVNLHRGRKRIRETWDKTVQYGLHG